MVEKEWVKINRHACSTIRLCLAKDNKYFTLKETSNELWKKLGDNFMTEY